MAADTVHIVEDDPALRDSLAFLLEAAGFTVRLYETGMELLERLAMPAAGCILTDIRMPGIDGLELLRRLREARHAATSRSPSRR
jgi:two-component system, LuxR family, response regulator FixJ